MQGHIEIEGEPFLQMGQNYCDQPPFKEIVGEVHRAFQIDEAVLRGILTWLPRCSTYAYLQKEGRPVNLHSFPGWESIRKAVIKSTTTPELRRDFVKAGVALGDALAPYPAWDEYIQKTFNTAYYFRDGTPKKSDIYDVTANETPTYAYWIARTQMAEARARLVGLESILPGLQTQGSIIEQIRTTGKGRVRRRWMIWKGSLPTPR